MKRAFYSKDGGFSTVGMVLAMLISLSLLFTSAQVYKVHSLSADIQNVADASALAAQNQVASYYVVAQVCDAVVLTLSLTGVAVGGVGAVALCVPAGAVVGEKLLDAAHAIMKARNSFAQNAAKGLNTLQKLLPFISAAEAYGVATANGQDGEYFALAILLPTEGEEVTLADDDGAGRVEAIRNQKQKIEDAAQAAEEAAKRADEHKLRAFMADCGAAPAYCMEERAASLAGLSGESNPHYENVDAWSFAVALRRAQAYYPQRVAQEAPANDSVNEQANSALRRIFYLYACGELADAWVYESEGTVAANFPLLPKNTAELRTTSLYYFAGFPITVDEEGAYTMHAWGGCPGCAEGDYVGLGSVADIDAGGYVTCPYCLFHASSLGSVAAASTSTANGFEHYYRIVAEEARAYQQARDEQHQAEKGVKEPVGNGLESLKELAKSAAGKRIEASPPGRYGAIAVATTTQSVPIASLFSNGFVASSGSLGPRAALSAATLGKDAPEETENVITSLFDGFLADSQGIAATSLPFVLDIWSAMLTAHARGVAALEEGTESVLNALPLVGHSGLGTWAREKLEDAIDGMGLEPADVVSYKPILANTYRVAEKDGSSLAHALLGAKSIAAHIPASAVNPVGAAIDVAASYATEKVDGLSDEVEIAVLEPLGNGGPSIPVKIPLPPAAKEEARGLIERARQAASVITGVSQGEKPWE